MSQEMEEAIKNCSITSQIKALLAKHGDNMTLCCTIGDRHISWHAIETVVNTDMMVSHQRSGFGLTPELALADCLLHERKECV